MRPVLDEHAARRLEHRHDRGLVVAAEDRPARVPHDPVLDDRLDRVGGRDGVEVRAEEERLARRGRLERDVEVAHRRADSGPGAVLVGPQAAVREVADHAIGDRALLARRARRWRRARGTDPAPRKPRPPILVRPPGARRSSDESLDRLDGDLCSVATALAGPLAGGADEVAEQRRRARRARLELGMELARRRTTGGRAARRSRRGGRPGRCR